MKKETAEMDAYDWVVLCRNKEGVMPSKKTINKVLDLLIDEIGHIRDVAEDCGSEDKADRLTDIHEALLDVLAYNHANRSVKVLLRMETV